MQTIYILSCETPQNGGGIYKYSLSAKGLEKQNYYACDRPMYAVIEGEKLFVILRQPFTDSENSGVFSLGLDFENPSDILSTDGIVACHLAVDAGEIYVVNYLSGNIVKVGEKSVFHGGKGINPARQDMSHTHCAVFSNDKKHLLCCDLGLDTLFCYDRQLKQVSKAKVPDGYGIRHAVFSNCGKYIYAITEMIPSICVFSFDNGKLEYIKEYKIPCKSANADGAGIRLSENGLLYVSLRVENGIAVYQAQGENLSLAQKTDCGGDSPRDFNLLEKIIIVANEKSDSVVVIENKDGLIGKKKQTLSLPKPLCVVVG